MGYDIQRFTTPVDEELICVICGGVLENAVMAEDCEHSFCKSCIETWLARQVTCPVDRSVLEPSQLKPVPRIMRNMLSRLQLSCDNSSHGCEAKISIDKIQQHQCECEFNPKKPVLCQDGCGLIIPKDEMPEHNCIYELHALLKSQSRELDDIRKEFRSKFTEQKQENNQLKRDIALLQEYIKTLRSPSKPSLQMVQQRLQSEDILRWSGSLTNASVMRWGGVISTPDVVLQTIIRRSLIDTGCPMHIVDELMENAHERRWPQGLNTLETRQLNRRQYDDYISKRIPGKQAIVILHCENQHMGPVTRSNYLISCSFHFANILADCHHQHTKRFKHFALVLSYHFCTWSGGFNIERTECEETTLTLSDDEFILY